MKALAWGLGGLLLIVAAAMGVMYAMSDVQAVRWDPPPNPGLTGEFSPNQALAAVEVLIPGQGFGPEDVAHGSDGELYAGLADGRIVRFRDRAGARVVTFADTGGRPLGLQFDRDGQLIVADAYRGLLSISPTGAITVLTDSVDGQVMRFVNDLDIAADGTIWFTDTSRRFQQADYVYDFLEARATGRLLSYSPASGETRVHLDGLFFANGVALGPLDAYVLVNETGSGRIHRLWLKGEPAGRRDLFFDALPGAPDNLSFNGSDTFWVALPGLREPMVEAMADHPLLRRILGALPADLLLPRRKHGFVVGLDLAGRVTYNLQVFDGRYHTVTSVNQYGDRLYLGSIAVDGVGVLPVP